jgi:hypothetical protein
VKSVLVHGEGGQNRAAKGAYSVGKILFVCLPNPTAISSEMGKLLRLHTLSGNE